MRQKWELQMRCIRWIVCEFHIYVVHRRRRIELYRDDLKMRYTCAAADEEEKRGEREARNYNQICGVCI